LASATSLDSIALEYGPCATSAPAAGHVVFTKGGLAVKLSAQPAPGPSYSEAAAFWGSSGNVVATHSICVSEDVRDVRGRVLQAWNLYANGALAGGIAESLIASGSVTKCFAISPGEEGIRWETFVTAESGRRTSAAATVTVTLRSVAYG
jgi:hypothetical protein